MCEATIKKNAIFSMRGYLASAPWKAWLTQKTESCLPSSSQIKATLTVVVDIAKYKYMFSPSLDELKKGGLIR